MRRSRVPGHDVCLPAQPRQFGYDCKSMEDKDHRRKSKRYPVKWKAAAVFDKTAGKPILHTETHDLSLGGAAIQSDYGDLTGSTITLLLAQPPRQGEQPR